MSFLRGDDYILIMDNPYPFPGYESKGDRCLKAEDLKKISDTGVKTVIQYLNWDQLEPRMGEFDWSFLDTYIQNVHDAGMKVVLGVHTITSRGLPHQWYLGEMPESLDNRPFFPLSMWNPDANAYVRNLIRLLGNRYKGDSFTMMYCAETYGESFISSAPHIVASNTDACLSFKSFNGDLNLHLSEDELKKTNPDPKVERWLERSIVGEVAGRNLVIAEATGFNEMWTAGHEQLVRQAAGMTRFFRTIIELTKSASSDMIVNGIQYTYWQHGQKYWDTVNKDIDTYGIRYYVGAEYCQGLIEHTPMLLQRPKIKGLLCSPLGIHTTMTKIENWMLDNLKASHRQICDARGVG